MRTQLNTFTGLTVGERRLPSCYIWAPNDRDDSYRGRLTLGRALLQLRKTKVFAVCFVCAGGQVDASLRHTPSVMLRRLLLTPARPSRRGQEHLRNCVGSVGLKPPNHKRRGKKKQRQRQQWRHAPVNYEEIWPSFTAGAANEAIKLWAVFMMAHWSRMLVYWWFTGCIPLPTPTQHTHTHTLSAPPTWRKSWQRGPCVTIFHAFNILIIR